MQGVDFQIEHLRRDSRCGYVEAFLDFCDDYDLDPLEVIQNISLPLKHKIEQDFIDRNMVKDTRNDNNLLDFF